MSTDEYMPSDDEVRESYVHGETCDREGGVWDAEVPGAQESFTRWLAAHDARIRRDAAREALDGLVQKFQWGGWSDTLKRGSQPVDLMGNANRVTGWMRVYRDTHYPETEDQT